MINKEIISAQEIEGSVDQEKLVTLNFIGWVKAE